ncbi:hypothetical protein MASR2M8_18520 [Opitutaceae bacterium]
MWSGADLLGCGALRELTPKQGEVKSMRTAPAHRQKGVARTLLTHLLAEARLRGYTWRSLKTGTQPPFAPAHHLYEGAGFVCCLPFGDYTEDPNSVFMTLRL